MEQVINFTIGVIISTYNNPDWLRKTLWGYAAQTRKADEIIIADDGSGDETRLLIESFEAILPIKHVWHEDNGFRKTVILNAAIRQSTADYLIFTDQDCVPRADFVATHATLARPGHFLSGGYFKLPMSLSRQITQENIISGNAFRLGWLKEQGLPRTFKSIKLIQNKAFSKFMNTVTPTRATWNGMNSSGWIADILAVNGFDERMEYGGLDRELGERMINYGIRGIQIRYSTVPIHLDHTREYKRQTSIDKNRNIRKHTRKAGVQWSPFGIVKDELAGKSAKVNSLYDYYSRQEERLHYYRTKGGLYRQLLSLPCQIKRDFYKKKVINTYRQMVQYAPTLSNHSGLIVSLTSFPPRIRLLHLTLQSILWQTCLPERIIVWLSEAEFPLKLDNLTPELRALISHGVAFRFVPDNILSHKKYYYVFKEYPDNPVITVDDDLIYPRQTIERLLRLSAEYPATVCGNIIRKMHTEDNGAFTNYKSWNKITAMPPNSTTRNVAIGCGGNYYPPRWYDEELFNLTTIRTCCPTADDLWLKANELRRNVRVAGGGAFYPRPIELPHTQNHSLQKQNNGKTNRNDEQWKALNKLWNLSEML